MKSVRCHNIALMSAAIVAFLFMSMSAHGDDNRVNIVTFADFGYVNSVATSINHVYFATTEGIISYNKVEERWEKPLTGTLGFLGEEAKQIWVDTFGEKLYARTNIGLYELDLFFDQWFPINDLPRINKSYLHTSPPEDILPAAGENYFGDGRFTDRFGRLYSISDMIDDQHGTFWIGTWGRGAARASNSSRVVERLPFGLAQNRVGTIFSEDSLLWLSGSRDRQFRTGITGFNPTTFGSLQIETGLDTDLPAVDINCLYGDKNYLYVGTEIGLLLLDRRTWRVVREIKRRHGLPNDRITSLTGNGDTLYVGTREGLSMITESLDSIATVYPGVFSEQTIYDLEIIGGHLWIGSSVGAYRLSLSRYTLQSYRDADAFLFSQVYDIESEGENIWFSADGGMLKLNSKTGKVETFQSQSSLPRRRVIAANESIAAINSNRGVTIFFLDDKSSRVSREFSVDDGLVSDNIFDLHLEGDYLWIGSDKGLTRLLWNDPRRVD